MCTPTYKTSSLDVKNPKQLTHFTLLVSFLNLWSFMKYGFFERTNCNLLSVFIVRTCAHCSSTLVSLIKTFAIFSRHYMKYHWPCKRGKGVNMYVYVYVSLPFCTSRHKTPPIQQNHCRPHQPVGGLSIQHKFINTT